MKKRTFGALVCAASICAVVSAQQEPPQPDGVDGYRAAVRALEQASPPDAARTDGYKTLLRQWQPTLRAQISQAPQSDRGLEARGVLYDALINAKEMSEARDVASEAIDMLAVQGHAEVAARWHELAVAAAIDAYSASRDQKNRARALECFEKGRSFLKAHPELSASIPSRFRMCRLHAWLLSREDKHAEARAVLDEAIQISIATGGPQNDGDKVVELVYTAATASLALGDVDDAMLRVVQAESVMKRGVNTHAYLISHASINQKSKARNEFIMRWLSSCSWELMAVKMFLRDYVDLLFTTPAEALWVARTAEVLVRDHAELLKECDAIESQRAPRDLVDARDGLAQRMATGNTYLARYRGLIQAGSLAEADVVRKEIHTKFADSKFMIEQSPDDIRK